MFRAKSVQSESEEFLPGKLIFRAPPPPNISTPSIDRGVVDLAGHGKNGANVTSGFGGTGSDFVGHGVVGAGGPGGGGGHGGGKALCTKINIRGASCITDPL